LEDFTMAAIKEISESSEKWVRRASVAAPDYARGVENPRRKWSDSTIKAAANYKQSVVAAANAGRFEKGVAAVGEDKWKSNALEKGPNRFTEGVTLSRDEWEKGFKPFNDTIKALTLPPRGAKGSPQNLQRVAVIAQAFRQVFEKGAS
jgi:hypothetical protein